MRRGHRVGFVLAAALLAGGCYGPFYLTRKVWKFNGEVSDNKWIVEVVYLVCAWLPVYGIAALADTVIFNSLEFWGADNPMADTADAGGVKQTKRIVSNGTEVTFKRVAGVSGDELVIEQSAKGQTLPGLRVRREGHNTIALNQDGAVLFSAQTLADGAVVITDGSGQQVASYNAEQAQQLLASARQ